MEPFASADHADKSALSTVDDLRALACDAAARGHASLAQSVEAVAHALETEDPVHVATMHDQWIAAVGPGLVLTRLLGAADGRAEHDAFHAAACLRVVRGIEAWFEEMSSLAEASEP